MGGGHAQRQPDQGSRRIQMMRFDAERRRTFRKVRVAQCSHAKEDLR